MTAVTEGEIQWHKSTETGELSSEWGVQEHFTENINGALM